MLPALTLGIGPTDPQGYLVDAWGNRVRYAVTNWSRNAVDVANCPPNGTKDYKVCPAFTTANAIASLGLTSPPAPALNTYPTMLRICDVAACSGTLFYAPAVIWSTGRNFIERLGPPATYGADEAENVDTFIPALVPADGTFVMHDARSKEATSGEFDDLVIWLSPAVLYSRLVSAGVL